MTRPYDASHRSVALADRSDRVRIAVAGPDRAKVLHNLTTNEIKRLAPGRGVEAFLTDGRGRTVAFLTVHAEADRLLVRSDPGSADAILGHLGKYGLFEDASFDDLSAATSEWHLVGPAADALARGLGLSPAEPDLSIAPGTLDGRPILLIREDPTARPGLTVVAARDDAEAVGRALIEAVASHGGATLDPSTFEALRIEAGTPASGVDVTSANLPQEVARDARAISFVKGCYLGQETVARLDAMGHVNKILVGAVADVGPVPPPGSTLQADGKDVGAVTSSAESPGWGRGVVLGYVKVAHATPGSELVARWDAGESRLVVHSWPMLPSDA